MTLPMTLIVISGEIDLSVASILGMSSALLGYLWDKGWPMPAIFVFVAVVGLAAGAVNGLLVTRLRLPCLAVTIGTLALYRGIATILLGPNTVSSFPDRLHQPRRQRGAVHRQRHDLVDAHLHRAGGRSSAWCCTRPPLGRSIYAMGAEPGGRAVRRHPGQADQDRPVHGLRLHLRVGRRAVHVPARHRRAEQRRSAWSSTSSRSCCSPGCRSSAARARSSAWCSRVLAFAGIQNALLLTNFNQEATGIVTGALLLASVFLPNAAPLIGRLVAPPGTGRVSPRTPNRTETRSIPNVKPKIERIQGMRPETGKEARRSRSCSSRRRSRGLQLVSSSSVRQARAAPAARRPPPPPRRPARPRPPRRAAALKTGLKVFVIPKNLGNSYFTTADSANSGGALAALQTLGETGTETSGTAATPSSQIPAIQAAITKGANALVVSATDPTALCPTLKVGHEARHHRRHLRLRRADLPDAVHQPGDRAGARRQRGRRAGQADRRQRPDRDRLRGGRRHQPERLDHLHEDRSSRSTRRCRWSPPSTATTTRDLDPGHPGAPAAVPEPQGHHLADHGRHRGRRRASSTPPSTAARSCSPASAPRTR